MNKILNGLALLVCTFLAPVVLAAGDAAAGQAKTAVCVACHGPDGNSPMSAFPIIAGLGEKYTLKQLLDIQSGERVVPEMTGMLTGMTEQDLADIAAYYSSQSRKLVGASETDLELGERIYRGGNIETGVAACTGCHSPTGQGNGPAGYPALGGQYPEYIIKQLTAFRTGYDDPENSSARVNDGEAQVMRGVAARMTDREIRAVANYIAGLR